MVTQSHILDQHGEPFQLNGHDLSASASPAPLAAPSVGGRGRRAEVKAAEFWGSALTDYVGALAGSRAPARWRAQDPFGNHVWVFAAAMTAATVAAQAPMQIVRETQAFLDFRRVRAERLGRAFKRGVGKNRRAIQRHVLVPTDRRLRSKALEPDPEHPLMAVLLKPNPLQHGNQLMQLTHLWLQVRGEVFWVLTDEEGGPVEVGQIPDRIWPLAPDLFQPLFETAVGGELLGWRIQLPQWMPQRSRGRQLDVSTDDVIQFKLPNPRDPTRGLSRLAAAAMGIETDLVARTTNRSLLENQAVPRGILTHTDVLTEPEEAELRRKWNERHGGEASAGRTAILSGGLTYQPTQLSPVEIQLLEQLKWGRDEILAALNMPKSVLGVTDALNYATQLGQDFNLWDKNLLPMLRLEETTIDESPMMSAEGDDVVALHDLTMVEALRAGVSDKVTIAAQMCGGPLHAPPKTAYEVVGLEIDDYPGIDVAFVSAIASTPVEQVLAAAEQDSLVPGSPGSAAPPVSFLPGGAPAADGGVSFLPATGAGEPAAAPSNGAVSFLPTAAALLRTHKTIRKQGDRRWRDFVKLQAPIEGKYKRAYRNWITTQKRETVERFDAAAGGEKRLTARVKQVDAGAILPSLAKAQSALKDRVLPIATGALEAIYDFTLEDLGGVATFQIDDPAIQAYFDKRVKVLVNSAPETLLKNLSRALQEGIQAGETVQQLRLRVAGVFDIAASSAKALTIARTESAALMDGTRDQIFALAGVTEEEWVSAGDEVVRVTHVTYGGAGPQDREFNYLELTDRTSGGVLAHPHDLRCTLLDELVNCRCIKIPIA